MRHSASRAELFPPFQTDFTEKHRSSGKAQSALFQLPQVKLASRPSYLAENSDLDAKAKSEETPED